MIKLLSKSKNIATKLRTTVQNKIRHIEKALKTSVGQYKAIMEERLKYWKGKL